MVQIIAAILIVSALLKTKGSGVLAIIIIIFVIAIPFYYLFFKLVAFYNSLW
jgi:hypothetical protein